MATRDKRFHNGRLIPAAYRRPEGQPLRGPTAWLTDEAGEFWDRDDYAMSLYWMLDPPGPLQGDRIRLHYPDGTYADGVMDMVATASAFQGGLVMDDGQAHLDKPPGVKLEVIERLPQPETTLTAREAADVSELLDELTSNYDDEPLGGMAQMMVVRLQELAGPPKIVLIENEVAVTIGLLEELGALLPFDQAGIAAHQIALILCERAGL